MIMLSKFPNFPDELSENDELREYELSGSDSNCLDKIMQLSQLFVARPLIL